MTMAVSTELIVMPRKDLGDFSGTFFFLKIVDG